MTDLLIKAIIEGGPYGVAVLGWAAWFWERRRHLETNEVLRDLSVAQIEATTKTEAAINMNTRVMESFLGKD